MASVTQKKKVEIKVEDGEIDLSMLALQEVPPIKDISKKKAHSLDLSINNIVKLPKNFPTLNQLVKLDLSKNLLIELPENFGDLVKLKHLDLYKNKLETLPLSFSKLKALKWLDLKDNPLMPTIATVAGPCLDDKQCQICAKSIVNLYIQLQNQFDENDQLDEQDTNFQTSIQKQKEQKTKSKKAKKNKGNKEDIPILVTNSTNLKLNEDNKNTGLKGKHSDSSSIYKIFKTCYLLLLTSFVAFFILSAAQISHVKVFEEKAFALWNQGVKALPDNLQSYGLQAEEAVKYIHVRTGEAIVFLTNCVYKLRTNESLNIIVTEAGQVLKNVTTTATQFYLKVFGE